MGWGMPPWGGPCTIPVAAVPGASTGVAAIGGIIALGGCMAPAPAAPAPPMLLFTMAKVAGGGASETNGEPLDLAGIWGWTT